MSKNLVLFEGWSRGEDSYQGLIGSAPKDFKIYHTSYPELIPNGRIDLLKENVLKFLEKNKLKKVNILGHSLGGALALEFAAHYPEKVEKLFLVDSEGVYDGKSVLNALWNVVAHSHSKAQKLARMLSSIFRILKNPLLHAKLGHFAHHVNLVKEAERIKVPTIIIWGENDLITPVWQGQKLHQLIKGSKLIILKNIDHDWILHSPESFWKNIV